MHLPTVTIIIPFYNCPYVDQAIASAIRQTYPNVEIIVIDDGATQYSYKIVPFMDQIYYIGKQNGGTASALNYGISLASGEYIAWLSSDDLFYPNKLLSQMTFMLANQADVSYTNFDLIDAKHRITCTFRGPRYHNYLTMYKKMFTEFPINGCTVIARKRIFSDIGLFNEHYLYTHDLEMWLRIATSGIPIYYLDESLIQYRYHEGMGTRRHSVEMQEEVALLKHIYQRKLDEIIEYLEGSS